MNFRVGGMTIKGVINTEQDVENVGICAVQTDWNADVQDENRSVSSSSQSFGHPLDSPFSLIQNLATFSPEEIEALQTTLKRRFGEIRDARISGVGSFKTVTPISNNIALARVTIPTMPISQNKLEEECQLLSILSDSQSDDAIFAGELS